MSSKLISELMQRFESEAEPGYSERVAKLFDLNVEGYLGVRIPKIRKIAQEYFHHIKKLSGKECLEICDSLLETGVYELKITAYQWAGKSVKKYSPDDIYHFESWLISYTTDWADCDDICAQVLGPFFIQFPEQTQICQNWAESKNIWVRRASLVSLIKPVKKDLMIDHALLIASKLKDDTEPMVKKALKWFLTQASKRHPEKIEAFRAIH